MNLIIKQLKGAEVQLQAQPSMKILELKEEIFKMLNIPVSNQKLLLMGRTLTDQQTVESYPAMKDNTKLNLIVKKPDGLFETAVKFLKAKGQTDLEAKNNAVIFVAKIDDRLSKLSWDDVERLSLDIFLDEYGYQNPATDHEHSNSDDGVFGL